MIEINIKKIVESLIDTFLEAGKISLELRKKGLIKKFKADNTPVSNGDLEVDKIITKKIYELTPQIPIISEETSDNKNIKNLENFWLIDPIDGTRAFMTGMLHWGVLLALFDGEQPVIGVLYQPYTDELFSGDNESAWFERGGQSQSLSTSVCDDKTMTTMGMKQLVAAVHPRDPVGIPVHVHVHVVCRRAQRRFVPPLVVYPIKEEAQGPSEEPADSWFTGLIEAVHQLLGCRVAP